MRAITVIAAAAAVTLLAGCNNNPPELTTGGVPVGSTATSGPSVSHTALGPAGINRNYYVGSDPNFPRGGAGSGGSNRGN